MIEVLQCDSVSGNERHVAEIIKEWVNETAKENGLQDRIKGEIDEDGNLIVILKGQHIEKIMFVFHMDTVKGFFQPRIEGGYIYGRGAVDNKCQGIAAIYSLLLLALNNIVPSFSIVVMGVTCEEINDVNKRGIIKAIKRYNLSEDNTPLIVILEATNMNVAIGQRPRWTGLIKVFGPGIHSAHVENNEIQWLKKREEGKIDAFTRFPDLRALVSRAVVELRNIPLSLDQGGVGRLGRTSIVIHEKFEDTLCNQTPSSGMVEFDIRLGDEHLKEEIKTKIKEILNKWLPSPFGYEWKEESDKCTGTSDFLNSKIGEKIVILLKRLKTFFEVFNAKLVTYEFGVDGRYTVEAGIPTIGLAPGDELYAHRMFNYFGLDAKAEMLERIKLLDLFKAIIVYFMFVQACRYHRAYDKKAEIRLTATYGPSIGVTDTCNFYVV
jgi:acetylornithine deacetylase/succinyl-diaminopimelate desuccinylase-like protein